MTTRTVRAEQPGPAHIRTNLAALDLTVIAEPGRSHAELTISTRDEDGPSAEAVTDATLTATGSTLEARLTQHGAGATTIVQTGRGRGGVSFSSINIGGGIIVAGSGTIMVNGRVINAGGSGATVISGGSPITVTAHVPEGSSVSASSISGDVETRGRLSDVTANSTSGDVTIETATRVRARTVSGDITIDELTDTADLDSTSGDVTVHGGPTARAQARTVSGDVRGTGGLFLDGSSVSGRVRNR
jgi:hypothetical protein